MSVVESVRRAADSLANAAAVRTACEPVSALLGTTDDVRSAYQVQSLNIERACAEGRKVVGRKIGLTSLAVQQQLGVDQPDYGTLFADMEYGDGVEVDSTRLLQPRVEAEVALVLGRDLDDAPHGFAEVVRSVEFALPAIEIVDSRIADWRISIVDTIADNASCGAFVVGGSPRTLASVDLRSLTMTMYINDVAASTGSGSDCLGHPLHAARWLADVMCRNGTPLLAGQTVLTGALGPMRPVASGDRIAADLGELGSVTTSLSGLAEMGTR